MSTVKFIVIVYSHLAASLLDGMLYLEDIHRLSHAPWFPSNTFTLPNIGQGEARVRKPMMLFPYLQSNNSQPSMRSCTVLKA